MVPESFHFTQSCDLGTYISVCFSFDRIDVISLHLMESGNKHMQFTGTWRTWHHELTLQASAECVQTKMRASKVQNGIHFSKKDVGLVPLISCV